MRLSRYVLVNASGNSVPGFFRSLSGLGLSEDSPPMSLFAELHEPREAYGEHRRLDAWFTEEGVARFSEGISQLCGMHGKLGHNIYVEERELESVPEEDIVYADEYQVLIKPESGT